MICENFNLFMKFPDIRNKGMIKGSKKATFWAQFYVKLLRITLSIKYTKFTKQKCVYQTIGKRNYL